MITMVALDFLPQQQTNSDRMWSCEKPQVALLLTAGGPVS